MYYVYIIKRGDKNKIYIGYTNNPKRRLLEHKYKKPELIYFEGYKNKLDAQAREKKLKQRGQAIRWLKHRIKFSLKEI